MAHFWDQGYASEVATNRHGKRSLYGFVDGHVSPLRFEETYKRKSRRDLWNPRFAR
jgi:prepilin-type processing-associated H-X9-DG protein